VYLRHSTVRKNGKTHVYWRLVRSVRRNGKVVQETVAQLGELDAQGRAKAKALARQITGRGDQRDLFEDSASAEATASVRLDRVRVERGRCFGDVWLGWRLWQALRLDAWCEEHLSRGREQVPWSTMAAVLVIARLCEPSSELHIAEDWYRRTALEDLLGLPADRVNDDRLYRALDHLLPHKEALEQHLVKRLGELFDLSYDLLLYDVTSTYFEGQAERNPLAQRGHSRDHRPDCKQVCIAMVVTREGMPLGYEVFAGNRTDVTTVEEIVEAMEKRYGIAQRVWVMDRGMSSADNVAWLQETGRRYLIGAPKSELKKWSREIAEARDWQTVRDGVEAKLCRGPDGTETFLLCRSADRRQKERAMHGRFSKRIEERLASLGRRLAHSRQELDRETIGRQIGRMLAQNSRAAGRYRIEVLDDPTRDSIQLTEAEAAFRIHKSDLSIRPVWHQKAERVQAHILVCFLAYVLWKTLEQWQRRAGLGNSPRTVLEELGRIQSADVVLPLTDKPGRELRIRCVVRPDPAQAMLLDRLGLRLPERLRAPSHVHVTKM
jgi:transposase